MNFALSALALFLSVLPGPLAQAITFRAFGASGHNLTRLTNGWAEPSNVKEANDFGGISTGA